MKYITKLTFLFGIFFTLPTLANITVNKTMPLEDVSNVSISNQRGNIEIIASNGDQVSVKGRLDEKAEKLIFNKSGTHINIEVKMPKHQNLQSDNNESGSQLIIHIPKQVQVDFNGVSSNVTIKDFTNNVDIQTVSGEITASNLKKSIELTTVSGEIKTSNLNGKLTLTSVNGEITDNNSNGRIHLQSVSGDVKSTSNATEILINTVSADANLTLAKVEDLELSTVSGELTAKLTLAKNGQVEASSVSGALALMFEDKVDARFQLMVNGGGDIKNHLTDQQAYKDQNGPSSKLFFQTGSGNGNVKLETLSGDISVK